jgi:arylsulfatase A-like enzyme
MRSGRLAWAQSTRPNIVFIMADDLGYADVSCYGQRDYTTPNIDRLAIEGLRFTQGYANSSVCSATRTALITGRYQYRLPVGLEEPINASTPKSIGLPADHPTLPSLLKKAGYGTTLVGKWHLGFLPDFSPLKSGYDQLVKSTFRTGGAGRATRVHDEPARRSGGADRGRLRQVAGAVPAEPAFHRTPFGRGRDQTTRPNRSALGTSFTATAVRRKPTPPWCRHST